jgi:hypothetical protein
MMYDIPMSSDPDRSSATEPSPHNKSSPITRFLGNARNLIRIAVYVVVIVLVAVLLRYVHC